VPVVVIEPYKKIAIHEIVDHRFGNTVEMIVSPKLELLMEQDSLGRLGAPA
jgi:hypothetical protein